MIIFLYGKDSYRSRKKLDELAVGFDVKCFEGPELVFSVFKEELRQQSLFSKKKMLIIKNVFGNESFKTQFFKNEKDILEAKDAILFYEQGEVKKDEELFRFLKKNGKTESFELLEGVQLKNWIKKEFERFGAAPEKEAIDWLAENVGSDLWRMEQEIMKLVNFKKGKPIEKKDVELLIKSKIETDVFKTIDALAQRNKKLALELIARHLKKGDSPAFLFSMINFQIRNILVIKDLMEKKLPYQEIQKTVKFHPFVVKKSYGQAQRFGFDEIKKIYRSIFQVDLDIKTGKISAETAIYLLAASI